MPRHRCCVALCNSSTDADDAANVDTVFCPFPSKTGEPEKYHVWLQFMQRARPTFRVNSKSRMCSNHFRQFPFSAYPTLHDGTQTSAPTPKARKRKRNRSSLLKDDGAACDNPLDRLVLSTPSNAACRESPPSSPSSLPSSSSSSSPSCSPRPRMFKVAKYATSVSYPVSAQSGSTKSMRSSAARENQFSSYLNSPETSRLVDLKDGHLTDLAKEQAIHKHPVELENDDYHDIFPLEMLIEKSPVNEASWLTSVRDALPPKGCSLIEQANDPLMDRMNNNERFLFDLGLKVTLCSELNRWKTNEDGEDAQDENNNGSESEAKATKKETMESLDSIHTELKSFFQPFLRSYQCCHCTYQATSWNDLEDHLNYPHYLLNNEATKYECPVCLARFERFHLFAQHHASRHRRIAKAIPVDLTTYFRCFYCSHKFEAKEHFELHICLGRACQAKRDDDQLATTDEHREQHLMLFFDLELLGQFNSTEYRRDAASQRVRNAHLQLFIKHKAIPLLPGTFRVAMAQFLFQRKLLRLFPKSKLQSNSLGEHCSSVVDKMNEINRLELKYKRYLKVWNYYLFLLAEDDVHSKTTQQRLVRVNIPQQMCMPFPWAAFLDPKQTLLSRQQMLKSLSNYKSTYTPMRTDPLRDLLKMARDQPVLRVTKANWKLYEQLRKLVLALPPSEPSEPFVPAATSIALVTSSSNVVPMQHSAFDLAKEIKLIHAMRHNSETPPPVAKENLRL